MCGWGNRGRCLHLFCSGLSVGSAGSCVSSLPCEAQSLICRLGPQDTGSGWDTQLSQSHLRTESGGFGYGGSPGEDMRASSVEGGPTGSGVERRELGLYTHPACHWMPAALGGLCPWLRGPLRGRELRAICRLLGSQSLIPEGSLSAHPPALGWTFGCTKLPDTHSSGLGAFASLNKSVC